MCDFCNMTNTKKAFKTKQTRVKVDIKYKVTSRGTHILPSAGNKTQIWVGNSMSFIVLKWTVLDNSCVKHVISVVTEFKYIFEGLGFNPGEINFVN